MITTASAKALRPLAPGSPVVLQDQLEPGPVDRNQTAKVVVHDDRYSVAVAGEPVQKSFRRCDVPPERGPEAQCERGRRMLQECSQLPAKVDQEPAADCRT